MTSRLQDFVDDILLVAVGLAFTGWGLYHGFVNLRLEMQGLVAKGRVISTAPHDCDTMTDILGDVDSKNCYTPEVEFTDNRAQKVSFRNSFVERGKNYLTGRDVDVLYYPDNPLGTALIRDRFTIWFDTWITLLLGTLWLLYSVAGLKNALRRRQYRREGDPLRPLERRERSTKYRLADDPEDRSHPVRNGFALLCLALGVYLAWRYGARH